MTHLSFRKPIEVDPQGRALNIALFTGGRPHMRALHFSWLSFLTAFTAWFAVPPLIPAITKDLHLTLTQIADSNISAVSATIVARLITGPLCDRFGPKRVMATILLLGSIPTICISFIQTGTELIIVRFFIGILGSTFVPCQFWTTQMFAPKLVGTANAIAGGWGNVGGGLVYILMPQFYNLLALGLVNHYAWRIAFIFPALFCIIMAFLDYRFADDYPHGDWSNMEPKQNHSSSTSVIDLETSQISRSHSSATTNSSMTITSSDMINSNNNCNDNDLKSCINTNISQESKTPYASKTESHNDIDEGVIEVTKATTMDAIKSFFWSLKDINVIILCIQYACSFGVELALDNIIGMFFFTSFGLNQTISGLIGSIFGLMNIFSRASGGLIADLTSKLFGHSLEGRLLAHFGIHLLEGITLLIFSFVTHSLSSSIIVMIFFSYFVQATCGTTYAVVPFLTGSRIGSNSGLIGAGGSLGGLIFSFVFKAYATNYVLAFRTLGIVVICSSLLTLVLRVQNHNIWGLYRIINHRSTN